MPVYTSYRFDQAHGGYLIWEIKEAVESLYEQVILTDQDKQSFQSISHLKRQKEFLAARLALQNLMISLGYDYSGVIKDEDQNLKLENGSSTRVSLTHSYPFAAACVHGTRPIGIDIQKMNSKLLQVQSKFLSKEEAWYCNNDLRMLCIYWSLKEAYYKAFNRIYGRKKNFFLKDIKIKHIAKYKQSTVVETSDYNSIGYFQHLKDDYILAYTF